MRGYSTQQIRRNSRRRWTNCVAPCNGRRLLRAATEGTHPLPPAGYVYSGAIAATGYTQLRPFASEIERVALLGPAHRAYLRGCALPDADAMETPLGALQIAREAVPSLRRDARAHAAEHSIEVHVPFVQRIFGAIRISFVLIVVGEAAPSDVAAIDAAWWRDERTITIVSSDLSHYLSADEASVPWIASTAEAITALDAVDLPHERACGATPVSGLILAARRSGMRCELLDLRNSADTAGTPDRVVGYGAFSFHDTAAD